MTAPFRIDLESAVLVGERRDGKGIPLALAHGFGGSRHDWQPLIGALPDDLPLITYDQRGFGDSTGEPGVPFSHTEDLLALIDRLGLAQIDLCGMSQGGAMALNFALSHPERARRLVEDRSHEDEMMLAAVSDRVDVLCSFNRSTLRLRAALAKQGKG